MSRLFNYTKVAIIIIFFHVCFFSTLPIMANNRATDPAVATSEDLLQLLVEEIKPERLHVIVDHPPNGSNVIGHLYLAAKNAELGGVRIASLEVEAMDVQLAPVENDRKQGAPPNKYKIESTLLTYCFAKLTEKDLNDSVHKKQFENDEDQWKELLFDFGSESLYAKGLITVDWLFTFDVLLELTGELTLERGKEIWLSDYTLSVNNRSVPQFVARKAIQRLQPLLDMDRFPFPVFLKQLVLTEEELTIATRARPDPFQGISLFHPSSWRPESAATDYGQDNPE
ncbi:MAG: DUF2993 domain-containing protein [Synergistales bacterium]|nr:DUF2993 domain-containing protein [Synergistales bacterium]